MVSIPFVLLLPAQFHSETHPAAALHQNMQFGLKQPAVIFGGILDITTFLKHCSFLMPLKLMGSCLKNKKI